ncbi:MAG: AAA family ATPase, partial [Bacteroidales bacterium]|nr:AAA family ATPase [Bacteroidales bacterium]
MENTRRYPVGIQTFSEIRKGGYIYIDKTDLVWEAARMKFVFLSRPRRFGKSLLTTTFDAYFKGQKELFEGLKIMDLETEWNSYPVIHLDLSSAKNQRTSDDLKDMLMFILEPLSQEYGMEKSENSPGKLLSGMIRRAYTRTGKQVAVIIDEYDAPLLDVLHEESLLPEFRRVMQELYQPLKASEAMLRFCFITGITKFSQLSIFSTINNLTLISLDAKYASICGITEEELTRDMAPDIAMLAREYECTAEQMRLKLKEQYDGYRFADVSPDIYNPFSLMKCFNQRRVSNYWFESG